MTSYRIIFAGTPEFAAEALEALVASKHEVVAVYTQPDRPAGRGQKVIESAVKQSALKHNIAVEQPINFKSEESLSVLVKYNADIMVVAAYGIILPKVVLDAPKLGCLNIHASLLPRWRGAAPIQRAIAAGDSESGITIMLMDEGLDTGDMLLKQSLAIEPQDTGSSLHDKLASLGSKAILAALDKFPLLLKSRVSQDNQLACYAKKLSKQEAAIDWSQTAEAICQSIRAFNSWPVAHTQFNGKTIRIWEAEVAAKKANNESKAYGEICSHEDSAIHVLCAGGSVKITQLQMPGKKPLSSSEVLNGHKDLFALGNNFE